MDDAPALPLDAETMAHEAENGHKAELRLWLRLLTLSNLIEAEIRRRLRERFDVTLPRFDLMAQLERAEEGMTLSEVSRRMMVSNGNVTGLVETLVASGHLERHQSPKDRRSQVIRLTALGRRDFARMAAEHQEWIASFFADLDEGEIERLMTLLGRAKASVRRAKGDTV
ncbi:MarR family transcriptional regulator [Chelatococcus sp. SYSU_G07232]|uniref:MarR family transcriptional regulator n=1 Tax=Chelatococcus albus TaxID=3047466 RepID=A0ABT7ADS7_9HYPH|nr:MarR family transcriptional regulator [Chelatococcus sp. SYSU_G07232]MDJ1157504.1 MarR family transcriptional regulator [Chelatococcus sp. SYSU_G07232]